MKNYQSLQEALESFQGANGKEEVLSEQFRELSEYLLYGGYLEVNGKRRVYLKDVEFYYHEEEGPVKDWIMYHRNTKSGQKKAYFPLGMLNAHQSGVDITFESEVKGYRVAVLVRGYGVEEEGRVVKEYDGCSTHLYEDLFMAFPLTEGLRVEWVHEPKEGKKMLRQEVRKNVSAYDEEGRKLAFEGEGCPTENRKYVQDVRKWRFCREV